MNTFSVNEFDIFWTKVFLIIRLDLKFSWYFDISDDIWTNRKLNYFNRVSCVILNNILASLFSLEFADFSLISFTDFKHYKRASLLSLLISNAIFLLSVHCVKMVNSIYFYFHLRRWSASFRCRLHYSWMAANHAIDLNTRTNND